MKNAVCLLLLALVLVPAVGCDKVNPTAPDGSVLTMSANPAQISLNGSSTITVIGRKPNGTPLNRGTEIRLTATLGSIEPFVQVDSEGVATAILRGDGRQGVATVTASVSSAGGTAPPPTGTPPPTGGGSSSGTSSVSLSVEIGGAAKTIVLQATPTNLGATGGTVSLVALIRDSRGQPLANAGVNFLTELGRLSSGGAILNTNANGQATDTLIVSESDIAVTESTGFTVTAQTTAGDGALVSDDFRITVQSLRPVADFTVTSGGQFRVDFVNASKGEEPLTFEWDFGDPANPDPDAEVERNPRHDYETAGTFTVTLRVSNAKGQDVVTKRITVASGTVEIED